MKIRTIYSNPIDRTINPAVVVSNRTAETIRAEIEEYIFTPKLVENLYELLNSVFHKTDLKTGIWVNGYYGSGKSHFIKFAHYCLNPETSDQAFAHYLKDVEKYENTVAGAVDEITPNNIMLLKKKIHQVAAENIMFNVEDETDDGSGKRLTRIFLNMLNKHRGYNADDIPLAILLEKQLDRKGVFETFKKNVEKKLGFSWDQDAANAASFSLSQILEIAKQLVPELDEQSLHQKLANPETYKVSISGTLIPELRDYIKDKPQGFRLLFLVDEVSAYIGKNKDLLLNFQSIVERISDDLKNQVWIASTAQQTIDEVATKNKGEQDIRDEFGKILGRFDTRISLQSNDASYITQKRLLEKNSVGTKALVQLFNDKKDYIQNQFKIRHELYKGYKEESDFILAYPFVPYQFKLIAHVFEAFQHLGYVIEEVKDNERSVLGVTHYTAKKHADAELGVFIPFDAFFNQQFQTNLTHRGQRAMENAVELDYVKNDPFAQRVVHCLFMISNLLQSQQQTFPPNLDNITVLMMSELDQNRMKLQTKIKEALDKLLEGNIIREEKGSFYFFSEDEIDVQNLIKNQMPILDEKLSNFDDFFRKMTRLSNNFSFGKNDFKIGYWVDDKEFFRRSDIRITVLLYDGSVLANKAVENSKNDLLVAFNEPFNSDHQLKNDFEWFCKTKKFFSNNADAATGERAKTIDNFRIRNEALEGRIKAKLEKYFMQLRFVSGQQIWEPDFVTGAQPVERTKRLLEKHLETVYKYEKLAHDYTQTQVELKKSAASMQTLMPNLSPAEELVDQFIANNGDEMNVDDLVRNFEKVPFGWRPEALLDILVHLVKKRKREFSYHNKPRFGVVEFINKAVISSERPVCYVKKGEKMDQATIDKAMLDYREIFNQDVPETTDGGVLIETLMAFMRQHDYHYAQYEDAYFGAYPFGQAFHDLRKLLARWLAVRDPKVLFEQLANDKQSAKRLFDDAKGMADFANRAKKDFDAIKAFMDLNRENFLELGASDQEKADSIADMLSSIDPRSNFRHAHKAYEELKKALREYLGELKDEVKKIYDSIFDNLEQELEKRHIAEKHMLADRNTYHGKISSQKSIAQLKNMQLDAVNFKSDQLQILLQYQAKKQEDETGTKVGEPEVLYLSKIVSTISNEAEMDAYLDKARSEIKRLLANQKTIIIK